MTLQFLLRNALDTQAFDALAFSEFEGERDALLTLLEIYRMADGADPAIPALKTRLEAWLIGNLETRLRGSGQSEGDVVKVICLVASQSYDAMREWLTTSADPEQVHMFHELECDPHIERRVGVPNSGLFRAALAGLLATNDELQPERLGAEALLALRDGGDVGDRLAHVIPDWQPRMIRGARWQSDVDARFLRDIHRLLATHELQPG